MDVATADWDNSLAQLLDELASVQDELLDVLRAKRECIMSRNIDSMTVLASREEALCRRLEDFQGQRRSLIEAANQRGVAVESLGDLASVLEAGKSGRLRKQVKTAEQQMSLVQHASLTNWVLAQRTLLHLSQLLEIIATGGTLKPTYGMDRSVSTCGALVDREA